MTRKVFVISLLQFTILIFFYFCGWFDANREIDTLQVKNKLLRKEIHNRQWEIMQAHNRNREMDMLRWLKRTTELQHPDWIIILDNVWTCSKKYNIRPELIMSIIHRESNFNFEAQSYFNFSSWPIAQGLMQINTAVWKTELNIDENRIMDPAYNIDLGCKILRMYLDDCGGDEIAALNRYWCGSIIPPNNGYVERLQSSKFYNREPR